MNTWLSLAGTLGGVVAVVQIGYTIWKDRKSGALRKGQAEAAKASLDTAQAEQSLPHVQEALKLGNLSEAVAIQQTIINGLRDHAAWQDGQMVDLKAENDELRTRLSERDDKIKELEQRLGEAEESLNTAKRLIGELRETSRRENGASPHDA